MEQPVPLSEISLPSSEYGTLSWADESSVPSERVQSYDVVFRPYNAADLSKISGWDGSSDVIYSSVRVVVSGIEENESQEEEWSEENNGEASEDQNDSQWEEENSGTGENDSQESEDHSTGSTDEDAGESNPDGQENDGTEEDSQQNSNGDSADKGNNESSGNSQTEGSQQDGDSDSAEENNSQESEDQNAGSKDEDASDSNGNGETEEESQQDGDSNPAEGESQDNAGDKEDMPEAGEKTEPTVTPEATVTPEVSVTPEPTVTPEADKDNILNRKIRKTSVRQIWKKILQKKKRKSWLLQIIPATGFLCLESICHGMFSSEQPAERITSLQMKTRPICLNPMNLSFGI